MTGAYWRFPYRKRHRLNGYIEVRADRLLAYEVRGWDGALLAQHHTMEEALATLKRL